MYSKLSLAFVAGLALVVQAQSDGGMHSHSHDHDHQDHHAGIFPTGMPYNSTGPAAGSVPTSVPTAGIFPTGTVAGSGISSGSGPEQTGDSTLTYTLGNNGHTTIITTTIRHTNTHTEYVYSHQTSAAAQGPGSDNNSAQGSDAPKTVHLTSTRTNVITTYLGETGAPGSVESGSGQQSGGCVAPTTITVQGPPITVTVTASDAAAPTDTGAGGGGNNNPPATSLGSSQTGGGDNNPPATSLGANQTGGGSQAPPYPLPSSKKHKTKCASTGFLTRQSVGPTDTGGAGPTGTEGMSGSHPTGLDIKKPYEHQSYTATGPKGSMAPAVSASAYKN